MGTHSAPVHCRLGSVLFLRVVNFLKEKFCLQEKGLKPEMLVWWQMGEQLIFTGSVSYTRDLKFVT